LNYEIAHALDNLLKEISGFVGSALCSAFIKLEVNIFRFSALAEAIDAAEFVVIGPFKRSSKPISRWNV
jgi:hypothetical protein